VFGSPSYALSSRFIDEIPAELTERDDLPIVQRPSGARLGLSWIGPAHPGSIISARRNGAGVGPSTPGGTDSAARPSRSSGESFRLGEDVMHAAFGEGVVTGVEPGGIIVVRFSGDGSERKLMADYAPVSRR
jgi:DNA helicase-2/ATP-dependent DNA helicase PcrA